MNVSNTTTTSDGLWHALGDELRAFLRSRVSNDADSDDLAQDVLLRIASNLNSLRDADRIQSWVFQIARNALVDFYRRQAKQPVQSDAIEVTINEDLGNQNAAIGRWLLRMVDRLPDTVRDAVRLYEIEGLPQSDIAQRLGLSLSGAKSRIQRGRHQLAELLNECCALERDRRGNVIDCRPNAENSCVEPECECQSEAQ
jgi:RNA polymerase sigma-70 factor (ECF subfamily)